MPIKEWILSICWSSFGALFSAIITFPLILVVMRILCAIGLCVLDMNKIELNGSILFYTPSIIVFIIAFLYQLNDSIKDYTQSSKREYEQKTSVLEKETERQIAEIKSEYEAKKKELKSQTDKITLERSRMKMFMCLQEPFRYSASLCSDMKTWIFNEAADYLHYKRPPAKTSASEIKKEFKKRAEEAEYRFSEMLYKYEFLLKAFPELKAYVDDEESLRDLIGARSYSEVKENYDNSRNYLSEEEWKKLTTAERNQLALDRWCKSNKSNHTIGLMYEMYVSSELRKAEWDVIEYGIKNGLSDLGRDIICHKGASTRIIQCKNWSTKKEIHENVICQLYGTTIAYSIEHPTENVKGVLLTTTKLSDMAGRFARQLNIDVHIKPLGLFPMIKCNINNGLRIYHLPFDQQYWRTEIKNTGEFYAWTVKEAEQAGFRRAFRHFA